MSSATLKKVFHGQHLSGPSRFSVFSNVIIKSFPRLLKYVRWESKDTGGKSLPKTLYNSDLNLDLLGSDWLTGWYIYISPLHIPMPKLWSHVLRSETRGWEIFTKMSGYMMAASYCWRMCINFSVLTRPMCYETISRKKISWASHLI